MKIKILVRILLLALLAFLSAEIILRRFFWNQIPAQVSPWFVYAVLLVNATVLAWQIWNRGRK